ncbi:MAG: hypothetical protein NTZ07_00790 [Candidatus Woesebacteria bacterium]|nr:hypothetical protein [Candidatus Woesebacteria bacterium]
MPDNMSPENPQVPISPSVKTIMNIGAEEASNFPRPSAVVEFPGAAEQRKAAEEFPQPEFKSDLPDIRMQKEDDDKDPNRERLNTEMRMQAMYGERGGYIREITGSLKMLKKLEGGKEGELDKERGKIAEDYKNILHTSLDEINSLNKYLENLRNPYPYDSRWTIQFFDQALEQVNDSLRNPEKFDKEGLAFLKVLKRDFLWASSAAKVDEAMGPAFEMYFDGEMELSRLRTSHTELTSEDFMRVFKKDVPGEDLTESEKQDVLKIIGKVDGLSFPTKLENGQEEKKIGLREVAVETQDRYGKLLYQLIGVGQKNLESVSDPKTLQEANQLKESGEHYAEFDRATYEFLSEVFNVKSVFNPADYAKLDDDGKFVITNQNKKDEVLPKAFESFRYKDKKGINKDGYRVKEATINPFCMDPRSDELAVRTFRARVQELIKNNDTYVSLLQKWNEDFTSGQLNETQLTEKIQEQVGKIFDITDKKILKWENLDEQGPYDRLTDTVMRNLNNLEYWTLASGDLGWEWHYDKISPFEIEEGSNPPSIIVETRLNGEKIRWNKNDIDPKVWDIFTTKILFKETKLGRDGRTFFIDNSGREVLAINTRLTQGEWDALSPAQKAVKHSSYEFSPNEWTTLSSKIVETETGNTKPDTDRLQVDNVVQFFVKRKSELGSIYDNHDVTTVMFLARHLIEYDSLADTRSTIFPPTIGWYRDLWESEPPYWRPRIENLAPNDHGLKKMLGLEGDTGITGANNVLENKVGRGAYSIGEGKRGEQTYGRYDPKAAEYVKENVWAFVTPFLEKPGDATSDFLTLPVFLPTQIKDMNFWRMVSLEGPSAKIRKYPNESIWHKRLSGTKLSDLKWENMDKYKYSWAVVTNDQMERWLGPLATPHDFNRMTADEVKKHYMMPSSKSEKEAGKRARLGGRGGTVPEGVLRATVFAQNKIISSIGFSNVLENSAIGLVLDAGIHEWVKKWVSPWVNVMLDMPSLVRDCTNYSGTAAQSAVVTYLQLERYIRSVVKTSYLQRDDVDTSLFSAGKLYK